MGTYKDTLLLVDKVTKPLAKIALKMQVTQKAAQNLTGTAGKLQRRMNYVGKAFTETGSKIKNVGAKISGVMSKLGIGLTGLSGAVGIAFNNIKGWLGQTAQYGDRIDKMSQKIGMSTKSFQEWDFIMSQNGGNVDNLAMGFKTLSNQMNGVRKGSKESIKAFRDLGVRVTDNTGKFRTQDAVFNDVIKALQMEKNETKKAILGNQLFGRSFIEMRPLLNQTAESIDELRKQAQDTIISDEDIKNAVRYTDAMDRFNRIFQAKMAPVVTRVMPKILEIMDRLLQHSAVFDKLIDIVIKLTDKLLSLVDWFMKLGKGGKIATLAIVGLAASLGPLLSLIGSLISSLGTIGTILTTLGITTLPTITKATPAVAGAIGTITAAVGAATFAFGAWAVAIARTKNELDAWGDSTKGMSKRLKINNLNTSGLSNSALEKLQYQRKQMGDKAYKNKYGKEGLDMLKQAEKSGRVSKEGSPMGISTTNNNNQSYTYNTTNNYGLGNSFNPLGSPGIVIAN